MYANITGPGKGHCPNAVLCNCLESEKLRESHPWTCDNRTVSLASNRPELIHKPVCACCSSKRFGHHRSSSQFLTFQVDTSHPVPEVRVRFCCRSTKVGFSGFCCSYGAHLKMYGKQREYLLPTHTFGMNWKKLSTKEARVIFPDIFSDIVTPVPELPVVGSETSVLVRRRLAETHGNKYLESRDVTSAVGKKRPNSVIITKGRKFRKKKA